MQKNNSKILRSLATLAIGMYILLYSELKKSKNLFLINLLLLLFLCQLSKGNKCLLFFNLFFLSSKISTFIFLFLFVFQVRIFNQKRCDTEWNIVTIIIELRIENEIVIFYTDILTNKVVLWWFFYKWNNPHFNLLVTQSLSVECNLFKSEKEK